MSIGSRIATSLAATFVYCILAWCSAAESHATIVRFSSPMGNVNVRLYDTATPLTTANFLNYANSGAWTDTFIHRSVPGFVVQGGGFNYLTDAGGYDYVTQHPAVQNEPGISNLVGTIAMAKLGGDPNSATNQWFFNLADNSSNLDNQNGGFTVFGRVIGSGMSVVNSIAALPTFNAGSPFDSLPLRNYTSGGPIQKANLVTFSSISVLNVPAGDYNFDGKVDAADLAVWKSTVGSTTNAAADGNGNGIVDGADFLIWQRTRGQNFGAPAEVTIAAIPEPAAATLAAFAAAAFGFARRRSL